MIKQIYSDKIIEIYRPENKEELYSFNTKNQWPKVTLEYFPNNTNLYYSFVFYVFVIKNDHDDSVMCMKVFRDHRNKPISKIYIDLNYNVYQYKNLPKKWKKQLSREL